MSTTVSVGGGGGATRVGASTAGTAGVPVSVVVVGGIGGGSVGGGKGGSVSRGGAVGGVVGCTDTTFGYSATAATAPALAGEVSVFGGVEGGSDC